MTLIECIPNFSEGRRQSVIDQLVAAVRAQPVHLLDVSSDADHNRTVITFAGEPDAVSAAAFASAEAAARLIDLERHDGVHPRIGAVDVIPFVPLRDATVANCVALAHRLGERIGSELGLPVYFYEAAAQRADRVNLADVRRGGYEALRTALPADPTRQPDTGPPRISPAGAVAIGVRAPLIAFNIYLDTDDVSVAQAVATAIRTASGGLPYVKALGLLVNGRAQVSINVIDYRRTSLFAILEAVRAAAERHGAGIAASELVGLTPRAALLDAALACLKLPPDAASLILEDRLGDQTGDYRDLPFE